MSDSRRRVGYRTRFVLAMLRSAYASNLKLKQENRRLRAQIERAK